MDENLIIKFCVVGEPAVGKTSMLQQYVQKKFDQKVRPTIGCDFSTKLTKGSDGKAVRMQLWDIAGQQRYNAVSKMYLRGALGCVIMCSAIDLNSLEETKKWKKIIEDNSDYGSDTQIPCILAQNKCDLIIDNSPQVYQTAAHLDKFAKENGFCAAVQCSAKQNKNVELIFQQLFAESKRKGLVRNTQTTYVTKAKDDATTIKLKHAPAKSTQQKSTCCK